MTKLFDPHRLPQRLCWLCSKNLPAHFTSVRLRSGSNVNVHYQCRPTAEQLAAGKCIESQPDYGDLELAKPI